MVYFDSHKSDSIWSYNFLLLSTGLVDEIMKKGRCTSYEELCDAVHPVKYHCFLSNKPLIVWLVLHFTGL